jgi:flagellar hook assembly protein FlgD
VRLTIFDVAGRKVATLVDDVRAAGEHTVVWEGRDDRGQSVPSGTYFYRLESDNFVRTRTMMLMK